MRINRKSRGGQPGNQNAGKHGFYTLSLSPEERDVSVNLTEKEGLGQDLALLRIRIKSILENDPPDRRALSRALKLLSDRVESQYDLGPSENDFLRNYIRTLFVKNLPGSNCQVKNTPVFDKTTESGSAEEK